MISKLGDRNKFWSNLKGAKFAFQPHKKKKKKKKWYQKRKKKKAIRICCKQSQDGLVFPSIS